MQVTFHTNYVSVWCTWINGHKVCELPRYRYIFIYINIIKFMMKNLNMHIYLYVIYVWFDIHSPI